MKVSGQKLSGGEGGSLKKNKLLEKASSMTEKECKKVLQRLKSKTKGIRGADLEGGESK